MLCVQQVSIVLAEGIFASNWFTGKKCSPSPLPPVAKERVVVTVLQKNAAAAWYWFLPVSS